MQPQRTQDYMQDRTPITIDPRKPLFSKSEYAALFDVCVRTVDSWIADGVVKVIRRGHVVRIVNDLVDQSGKASSEEKVVAV